jgi:hypothetical protein
MSSQRTVPVRRPVPIICCLTLAVAVLLLAPFARYAQASYYKMLICGAGVNTVGAATETNTASSQNPSGIFTLQTSCDSLSYPAGDHSFFRIAENQESGNAGYLAYAKFFWEAPGTVTIAGAGGYTREPNAFNLGWRGRFWVEGYDGSTNNILMQGSNVENGSCGGVCWNTTPVFGSHLWPFPSYGTYRRFSVEMTCFREAGCDRTNFNAYDANSLQLILNDSNTPGVSFSESPVVQGQWVTGTQPIGWSASDGGSGLRYEWLRIDGGDRAVRNHTSECDIGVNSATGEFARDFQPCPTQLFTQSNPINTATLADGAHTMEVCVQDYAESVGLNGTGGEECDKRTIRTDNTPPAPPQGLVLVTSNPNRYLDHFGARWTLPSDPGSPNAKVHYEIVDAGGNPVVPEKTIGAGEPVELKEIEGPKVPGDYRLRVWLEDSVGLSGPAASVAIPRDTTPPAAPQDLTVTPPDVTRSADGFDVQWRNITDSGAPIDALHYEILDANGKIVVPAQEVKGDNPQALESLLTPTDAGTYMLRLWLSDAEGNVGAPVSAPLAYSCARADVAGGRDLSGGLGGKAESTLTVAQGHGSSLGGRLRGSGDPIGGAALCVFARVTTHQGREFLGTAMSGRGGEYAYPIPPGPSRELIAIYRGDHREVEAHATLETRVKPTFHVKRRVVHNGHKACFYGQIPGPDNDKVVVDLQVKSGKGWRAFRRYRTRSNGHYEVCYRFTRTRTLTVYPMRAQVRETVGYPYLQGNSSALKVKVMP